MKKFITEPERNVEIVHETDVLIVGSGPGGLSAALAASRAGVKVTLVERFGCFGGNITVVGLKDLLGIDMRKPLKPGVLHMNLKNAQKLWKLQYLKVNL